MEFHTVIGSLGVKLLLLAYLLLQLEKISTHNLLYVTLNFSGAVMAMWSSYLTEFLPFVIVRRNVGISIIENDLQHTEKNK